MEASILSIKGSVLGVDTTKNGHYIVKFLVGDKVLKVFTKENGLKTGDVVQVACDPPEDAKFPMMFEKSDLRRVAK